MSRYNNYGLPPNASSNKSSGTFNPGFNGERHDDHASQSGSDDGNYALYPDAHKIEGDLEDDSNSALTSQTLNADGTPKRPMNAFMIFARRRRPQVSAENQAMRTGEISKILSKEWVSMSPSDKQFYLEQAKQLKETFNTRYPDYVYRRRPNNSRKRRRSDAGRPADALADNQDDGGSVDLEVSPTDADDHLEASLPPSYSRPPYSMGQPSIDHGKYGPHPRSAGHQVSVDPPFRMGGHHESRLSYGGSSHSDRMGTGMGSASHRLSIGHDGMHYGYGQSPVNPQSPSIFGTEPISPNQPWQPRWLGSPQDRVSNTMGIPNKNPYSTTSASPWSHSTDHPSASSNHSPTTNYFPTLNTPFYPNQQHVSPFQSNLSTSPSLGSQSSSYEPLSHMQSSSMSRDFTPRGYSTSSSITPGSSYPPSVSARDPLSYPQRNLPPVQTVTGYSNSQPSSSSSSSGHGHAPPPFWSKQ